MFNQSEITILAIVAILFIAQFVMVFWPRQKSKNNNKKSGNGNFPIMIAGEGPIQDLERFMPKDESLLVFQFKNFREDLSELDSDFSGLIDSSPISLKQSLKRALHPGIYFWNNQESFWKACDGLGRKFANGAYEVWIGNRPIRKNQRNIAIVA
ncbi:MAG: hypothetical protein AAB432_00060 [Patescibacteria group bacterium]